MRQTIQRLAVVLCFAAILTQARPAVAQSNQTVYDDALRNGWQNWSWAATNLSNTSPRHSGAASIGVSAAAWQALYLHHDAFDTSIYTSLTFWIHGGTSGGQQLQVQALLNGTAQPAVTLVALPANTWQQVTLSMSTLGVANKPNMDGFWIQDRTGTIQPTFYVDDIQLIAAGPPATVHLSVNAATIVRTVDRRMFGLNSAVWDANFNTQTTINLLTENNNQFLRFPGGSLSDEYHWQTNTTRNNTWTWATSFDAFANVARATGAQVVVTTNYGSGTAAEAAGWVQYSNLTKAYGFKYWEIGNECYGSWEYDTHAVQWDPYTYGTLAKDYINQMKAMDPTIKVGVVVNPGEDSFANNTSHPATNPRTGQVHNGWTPVLLTTLRNLGVTPDFAIYHVYMQNPGGESDSGLLGSSAGVWPNDVSNLRQQLTDYLGGAGAGVEITCTENNSVSSNPGKQTTSLVNGLFMADSIGQALQTEVKGLVWWDMRNGQSTTGNNSASLYGWRQIGDYGVVSDSTSERFPAFYVSKLLKNFARGGDAIIPATSDYSLLSIYSAKRLDGSLSLLAVNKSATNALNGSIAITGYTPGPNANVYFYGIPQDNAAQSSPGSPAADVQLGVFAGAAGTFSYTFPAYSVTLISMVAGSGGPTLPAAPTGLTATPISASQVNLAWSDNSTNETGFHIERSTNGTSFTQIATVGAGVKTYSNTGLARNTLYYYRVNAFNAAGNSAYSNTANARTKRK